MEKASDITRLENTSFTPIYEKTSGNPKGRYVKTRNFKKILADFKDISLFHVSDFLLLIIVFFASI